MVRVCMISAEYTPNVYGGLGRHVTDLAQALARRDVEAHVVTHSAGEAPLYERQGNLHVHRVRPPLAMDALDWDCRTAINNCGYVAKALQVIGEYDVDVLHAQESSVCHALLALRELVSIPVVSTIHLQALNGGNPLFAYRDTQVASLIGATDLLICCSRYMKEELTRRYPHAGRVAVVPNGVFPERFPFAETLGDGILFVGRLVPRKGVHDLIRAYHLIHRDVEGDLTIVGGGGGSYQIELHELASELGIGDRVHFEGQVENAVLARYFSEARVLAIPSLQEPFGIVALEAMSSGVPVVAYDAGGLGEIIQDGVNGFKVQAGDVEGLAERLKHVYRQAHGLDDLRRQARRDVERHYTWERVAARTAELYCKVTGRCKDMPAF